MVVCVEIECLKEKCLLNKLVEAFEFDGKMKEILMRLLILIILEDCRFYIECFEAFVFFFNLKFKLFIFINNILFFIYYYYYFFFFEN